jgi:WD40 repeat protein
LGRLERDHPGYLLKLGEGQAHGRFLDDATLQVVGSGGTVATWDLATGERGDVRRLFSARPGELCSARVGAGLVVGGTTLGLVWDLGGTITREDEREYVSCLSVSRDQRLLAVGFMNRRVVVFDVATRRRVLTTEPHDKRVFSIAFTPDGSKVVACSGVGSYLAIGSNQLRVYRVEGGETLADFDTVSLGRALAVAPSGLGFVGTNTGGVDIWDLGRGRRVFSLHGKAGRDMRSSRAAHAGSLRAVAFSEDGTTVVTLGVGAEEGKNEVIAWDVKTRAPIGAPMVRPTMLFALDISPDGRQMAVGCSGGVVEVWTLPK